MVVIRLGKGIAEYEAYANEQKNVRVIFTVHLIANIFLPRDAGFLIKTYVAGGQK